MSARAERSTTESIEVVPIRGPAPEGEVTSHGQRPRLVRTSLILDDGTRVGVSIAGRGLPLVVVHGYSAEGFLYAQTLSRLVDLGFQVVAIDTAGHGGTQGFPAMGAPFSAYVELLGRAIDALGIRHAVLAGHSMGGRMVAELASLRPERTVGVVLLDAIVGDTWDRMTQGFRVAPFAFLPYAGLLIWDSVSPLHFLRDPAQAVKFARLGTPVLAGHFRHPGRLAGPAMSLVRSGKST
ncbi:MAG: alpha/beta hydrolase, partial [Acidimicrobiales bacterium]